MISYENTKTVQDLVWNTGREYAGRVFLRYEENDVVYEVPTVNLRISAML